MSDSNPEVLTTGQVARICRVAPRTVSKWVDSGQLRGYRIPGSRDRRIPRGQLIRFMQANGLPMGDLVAVGTRVLLVDLDRELLDLLAGVLSGTGRFQVRTATGAFEAGALAEEFHPQVLLVDLDVLGMDPPSLVACLARNPGLEAARLLITAASLTPDERALLLHQGAEAVLPKPYSARELLALLEAPLPHV